MKALTLAASSVAGGCAPASGTVTLMQAAPTGGVWVPLSSTIPAAAAPAGVVVPAGATSATFAISTSNVGSAQNGAITATMNGASVSAALQVRPIAISAMNGGNSMAQGQSITNSVILECAAPVSFTVALTSSNKPLVWPATSQITINAGSSFATYSIKSSPNIVTDTQVDLTATLANGSAKTKTISVFVY